MAKIVDLTGKPISEGATNHSRRPNEDIQSVIDYLSWLNQEGRCSGVITVVLHKDGQKTKAYALDPETDSCLILGVLEDLKDFIKKEITSK